MTKAKVPDLAALPIRAAQYVRMSTEHQQYSIDNQSEAISLYARQHHMQIVKTYSLSVVGNVPASVRYSPAEVVKVERTVVSGTPDVTRITTSHIEKQNHTLRMHCRRLSRLTNAFSKKFENFEAAVALNFAYYNFCLIHRTIRMTPAMAAGVASSIWTVADLVKLCGE